MRTGGLGLPLPRIIRKHALSMAKTGTVKNIVPKGRLGTVPM